MKWTFVLALVVALVLSGALSSVKADIEQSFKIVQEIGK
jgi:hypothetical protein